MLTTTYGLSVISIPICAMGLPIGPIENGTTYIVRPRIAPSKRPSSVLRIAAGAIQLLVGPASSSRSLQMNVRSSTRATSDGSEQREVASGPQRRIEAQQRARWRPSPRKAGRIPPRLPSHQTMRSGLVSAAISATQASSRACRTYGGAETAAARAGIESGWFMRDVRDKEGGDERRGCGARGNRRFYTAASTRPESPSAATRSGGLTDSARGDHEQPAERIEHPPVRARRVGPRDPLRAVADEFALRVGVEHGEKRRQRRTLSSTR